MSSPDIDNLIKSLTPSRATPQSVYKRTLSFIDNINRKPPPVQMAVGGGAGLTPHRQPLQLASKLYESAEWCIEIILDLVAFRCENVRFHH
ncbi:unnamed protein product [Cylicocyclus nassatus]|uniref:Uncharacterized protein n=1 Tax=Cylicocyclus nassatus TaxID=53992 RepID=A0AA36M7Z1_CYLNA|nr:unnamed protein product [Cylicocyclus nassatus]